MSDGYFEIWREDAADQPDDSLRLRLLVRDAGAPSATNLGGLEIDLVGLGEAPNPESGVWVPPTACAAFLAWCLALPEAPASPLTPDGRTRSISEEKS